MISKYIKITLLALFIVILAEVIFYFFIAQREQTPNLSTTTISPTPNSLDTAAYPSPIAEIPEFFPAYDTATIQSLNFTRANSHVQTQISQQFKGIIHSFITPKVRTENGQEDGYGLLLDSSGNNDTYNMNTFILPSENLPFDIEIVEQSGNDEVPLSLENLQPGDTIIIHSIMDLTKPLGENLIEYKITRETPNTQ